MKIKRKENGNGKKGGFQPRTCVATKGTWGSGVCVCVLAGFPGRPTPNRSAPTFGRRTRKFRA